MLMSSRIPEPCNSKPRNAPADSRVEEVRLGEVHVLVSGDVQAGHAESFGLHCQRMPWRRKLRQELRSLLAPRGSRRERIGQLASRALQLAGRKVRRWVQLVVGAMAGKRSGNALQYCNVVQYCEAALSPRKSGDPYDVLCLPIIEWGYRFQRPQQLMRQFARHGHRVFYVSHEFLMWSQAAAKTLESNIVELRLRANVGEDCYRGVISDRDAKAMADVIGRLPLGCGGDETVVMVQLPFWTRLAEELRSRFGWRIVYDCMDDLSGFSRRANAMVAMEERMLEVADVTIATADLLQHKVQHRTKQVAVVRNGVDYGHFAGEATRAAATAKTACSAINATTNEKTPTAVIGYYGAIARWFDSDLVAELAALRPQWRFQLIGDTYSANLARLRKLPNIELIGERPYAELPRWMANWNSCIIPFKRTPLTEATNPVKVYEMLAAGKPVVAVDLPELRPIARSGLIEIAENAQAFAAKIDRLLDAESQEIRVRRQTFARQNTWAERFQAYAAAVAACQR
jgi:hypothetical protein